LEHPLDRPVLFDDPTRHHETGVLNLMLADDRVITELVPFLIDRVENLDAEHKFVLVLNGGRFRVGVVPVDDRL
jgi:hypothetical protein